LKSNQIDLNFNQALVMTWGNSGLQQIRHTHTHVHTRTHTHVHTRQSEKPSGHNEIWKACLIQHTLKSYR